MTLFGFQMIKLENKTKNDNKKEDSTELWWPCIVSSDKTFQSLLDMLSPTKKGLAVVSYYKLIGRSKRVYGRLLWVFLFGDTLPPGYEEPLLRLHENHNIQIQKNFKDAIDQMNHNFCLNESFNAAVNDAFDWIQYRMSRPKPNKKIREILHAPLPSTPKNRTIETLLISSHVIRKRKSKARKRTQSVVSKMKYVGDNTSSISSSLLLSSSVVVTPPKYNNDMHAEFLTVWLILKTKYGFHFRPSLVRKDIAHLQVNIDYFQSVNCLKAHIHRTMGWLGPRRKEFRLISEKLFNQKKQISLRTRKRMQSSLKLSDSYLSYTMNQRWSNRIEEKCRTDMSSLSSDVKKSETLSDISPSSSMFLHRPFSFSYGLERCDGSMLITVPCALEKHKYDLQRKQYISKNRVTMDIQSDNGSVGINQGQEFQMDQSQSLSKMVGYFNLGESNKCIKKDVFVTVSMMRTRNNDGDYTDNDNHKTDREDRPDVMMVAAPFLLNKTCDLNEGESKNSEMLLNSHEQSPNDGQRLTTLTLSTDVNGPHQNPSDRLSTTIHSECAKQKEDDKLNDDESIRTERKDILPECYDPEKPPPSSVQSMYSHFDYDNCSYESLNSDGNSDPFMLNVAQKCIPVPNEIRVESSTHLNQNNIGIGVLPRAHLLTRSSNSHQRNSSTRSGDVIDLTQDNPVPIVTRQIPAETIIYLDSDGEEVEASYFMKDNENESEESDQTINLLDDEEEGEGDVILLD